MKFALFGSPPVSNGSKCAPPANYRRNSQAAARCCSRWARSHKVVTRPLDHDVDGRRSIQSMETCRPYSRSLTPMSLVVNIRCPPAKWSPVSWCKERTMENLSATLACLGNNSEISMPGTFVRIGRQMPRYSTAPRASCRTCPCALVRRQAKSESRMCLSVGRFSPPILVLPVILRKDRHWPSRPHQAAQSCDD